MDNIIYVSLKKENVTQLSELIRLFERAFEISDHENVPTEHLAGLLSKPDFLVLVALDGDNVSGGLTGHVLPQYYTQAPQFYLYDIAVDEPYRRRGIASGLLQALTSLCQERGYECFYVQADADDDDAVAFYRSTSAKEQAVFHYTFE